MRLAVEFRHPSWHDPAVFDLLRRRRAALVWSEWRELPRIPEVTADFLEGREEYPVGKRLLGLDAAEFEKTALLLQGEMDGGVPGDEKARRGATLKSRLENPADTHIGDTNATEALKVLEDALRRYDAHELEVHRHHRQRHRPARGQARQRRGGAARAGRAHRQADGSLRWHN